MKVLVLVQDYPNNDGDKKLMYVHVRNKYYMQNGIDVTVLNFSSNKNYIYDGIRVVSEKHYIDSGNHYDILICHAANLKNHYRFLKRFGNNFPRVIFFFHGHEVLKVSKEYPRPYPFIKQPFVKKIFRDFYDEIKFVVWRKYFKSAKENTQLVFVSRWLKTKFFENLKLNIEEFADSVFVINNSVGRVFEKKNYEPIVPSKYDFITIRSNLDSSTYCIDLVNQIASENIKYRFLLIGNGEYFRFNSKSNNIDWIEGIYSHEELIKYINQAKCGLMLTRNDTQGVMACEMATFGIPLITSDIEVCREIFSQYSNVKLVDNNDMNIDLEKILLELNKKKPIDKLYCGCNTIRKEVELIKDEKYI